MLLRASAKKREPDEVPFHAVIGIEFGASVALFILISSRDMAPIEEQGVLEHHLVACDLAKGREILFGQADLSDKA